MMDVIARVWLTFLEFVFGLCVSEFCYPACALGLFFAACAYFMSGLGQGSTLAHQSDWVLRGFVSGAAVGMIPAVIKVVYQIATGTLEL